MEQNEIREMPPGLALMIAVSIIVLFGGLIVSIIYVAFYAVSFSTFQKIAVILVVILAMMVVLGSMWTYWGMKQGRMGNK